MDVYIEEFARFRVSAETSFISIFIICERSPFVGEIAKTGIGRWNFLISKMFFHGEMEAFLLFSVPLVCFLKRNISAVLLFNNYNHFCGFYNVA